MPLLRLASFIIASLLVAALSALSPAPANPAVSHAIQPVGAHAQPHPGASSGTRSHPGADAWLIASLDAQRPEWVGLAGQSIPETGQ